MLIPLLLLLLTPVLALGELVPDYDRPYSPIFTDKPVYSWTDKIRMTIVAPSWNADVHLIDSIGDTRDHSIKISSGDHSLEPYRFTETDMSSGIFTAEVILTGFLHDSDGDGDTDTMPRTGGSGPTGGFLAAERDSAVTISFEFADGVVLTESVPVTWNLATINFSQDVFFLNDGRGNDGSVDSPVVVRVYDPDMNLNPEALDHAPIRVYSDSDVAGVSIDAVESSEDSGMFTSTIHISQKLTSSANRLFALPGDSITARYDDYTLPKPHSKSDSIGITTSTRLDTDIPPLERLDTLPATISDLMGNPVQSFISDRQLLVGGTAINEHDLTQEFVYLFQIIDSNNLVVFVSWVSGTISMGQHLGVSQSWTPTMPGTYKIETYIWDSIKNPTALAQPTTTTITVE